MAEGADGQTAVRSLKSTKPAPGLAIAEVESASVLKKRGEKALERALVDVPEQEEPASPLRADDESYPPTPASQVRQHRRETAEADDDDGLP